MNRQALLDEIRDMNLAYLVLAQKLIREDREEAIFRLGISAEASNLILQMTTSQLLQVASGPTLLCQMRDADDAIWSLLTNQSGKKVQSPAANRFHASILSAGRPVSID